MDFSLPVVRGQAPNDIAATMARSVLAVIALIMNGLAKFVITSISLALAATSISGGNTQKSTISALRRLLVNNDVFYDVGSHEGSLLS